MSPYNDREGRRRAFQLVPETCPKVSDALAFAKEQIIEQTEALRDCLIEVCVEVEDLKDRIRELEDRLKRYE